MKIMLIASLFLSLAANAAPAKIKICGKFVVCGTFQAVDNRVTDHVVIREFVFEASGPNKLIAETAILENGKREVRQHEELTFRKDGSWADRVQGGIMSSGICNDHGCTMAGRPRPDKDGKSVQETSIFRFTESSFSLHKFYVDGDGQPHNSLVIFSKQ